MALPRPIAHRRRRHRRAARRYDVVIVGMGSAGLVAAEAAAAIGLRVALVERDRPGGDCLWTGCVPSKALLASARAAQGMRDAGRLGLEPVEPKIDTAKVFARLRTVQERIAATDDDPDRYAAMGLDVRVGAPARLLGPHAVDVGGERLATRFVLLCTGSHPRVPELPGLDAVGFETSETVWALPRAPASLLILGGGPIAAELSQAFTRLGTAVTVLQREGSILTREEPELAERLSARLRAEGVVLETGVAIDRAAAAGGRRVLHGSRAGERRSWAAETILVAVGRRPRIEDLGLDAVGVRHDAERVIVDERSRTSVPSIYAVGDVAGRHRFTHAAAADGVAAIRDMVLPGSAKASTLVPWCTFTEPELAHVGLTVAEASERHGTGAVEGLGWDLAHTDRGRIDASEDGRVIVVTAGGRIVGGHVLAPGAGEMIQSLTLAITHRMRPAELASVMHVYPTLSTAVAQLGAHKGFADARRYRPLVRTLRWVSAARELVSARAAR